MQFVTNKCDKRNFGNIINLKFTKNRCYCVKKSKKKIGILTFDSTPVPNYF